ncbi:sigma-70 family RNA polymerase sigma factor [candidate division WOR-3 bacterium]|nr:sigma-70 family RNA polymerase sigma factor [candidate division WOR-3 bacterium]
MKEDNYWIRRVKNGKRNDFSPLVKRYKDAIFYFILKMVQNEEDAVDLTQESFIKAFNKISKFKEEYSFKNWLFTIASHHTIDFLRKKKQMKETDLLEIDIDRPYVSPIDAVIKDERMKKLSCEINLLPENYRMVILLKHKEELKIEEISEIMGVPHGTVKVWLHRAREQLRKRMAK